MIGRRSSILALLALPALAAADELAVYESMSTVSIGRVFLTQDQRARLDARRLNPGSVPATAAAPEGKRAQQKRSPGSAGYIVSGDGKARVWKDGDFIRSGARAAQRMAFPGDVKVRRHGGQGSARATAVRAEEHDAADTDAKEDRRPSHHEVDGNAD